MHRLHQHRTGAVKGFTNDHGIAKLMWFEQNGSMESAILREKQVKKWNRQWRIDLFIESNPEWRDLAIDLGFDVMPSTRVVARSPHCHPRESGDPSPAARCGDGSPLSRG